MILHRTIIILWLIVHLFTVYAFNQWYTSSHCHNNTMKEIKRIAVICGFLYKHILYLNEYKLHQPYVILITRNPSYCYCSTIYFSVSFSLHFFFLQYYIGLIYCIHYVIRIWLHCEVRWIAPHTKVCGIIILFYVP